MSGMNTQAAVHNTTLRSGHKSGGRVGCKETWTSWRHELEKQVYFQQVARAKRLANSLQAYAHTLTAFVLD